MRGLLRPLIIPLGGLLRTPALDPGQSPQVPEDDRAADDAHVDALGGKTDAVAREAGRDVAPVHAALLLLGDRELAAAAREGQAAAGQRS